MAHSRTHPVAAFVVVLAATLSAAGCPEHVEQPPACALYLSCFFPGGESAYPQGVFDGGIHEVDGGLVQNTYSFASFDEPEVEQALFDAYGENGRCWRAQRDALGRNLNQSVSDACELACKRVLFEDCLRRDAHTERGSAITPVCLAPERGADYDDLGAGPDLLCESLGEALDAGYVPPDDGQPDAGG